MGLSWNYVSPLKDGTEVDDLELKYCYRLPDDLKQCLTENNAGTPSLSTFDFGDNKGKVFGALLSMNEGDMDSIYDYINLFETADGKGLIIFPFGIDPAGNFLCVRDGKVVFYEHESDAVYPVADSFSDFLKKLY